MADRTSQLFPAIASDLIKTYTTGSENSSGQLCQAYDRIIVYVTTANVVSSGIVAIDVQWSDDGTTFYTKTPTTAVQLSVAGNYKLDFGSAGKYFRVKASWVSGTSIDITAISVEGKS